MAERHLPQRLSALGLDVGRKRIGVAGCDGLGLAARGLLTLRRESFDRDVERLDRIVAERHVQILVIGLPYTMSGNLGYQARQTRNFGDRLAIALGLPVEYVDERLTSVEAESLLRSRKVSPSRNRESVDREAATLILQRWLDQRHARSRSLDPSADLF